MPVDLPGHIENTSLRDALSQRYLAGFGIAVLPHFMATAHPELRPVLPGEITISRTRCTWLRSQTNTASSVSTITVFCTPSATTKRLGFLES